MSQRSDESQEERAQDGDESQRASGIVRFRTESDSVYEAARDRQHIRRLYGESEPTPRTGQDGVWKKFFFLSPIVVGEPVLIAWSSVRLDQQDVTELMTAATITSPVKEILK